MRAALAEHNRTVRRQLEAEGGYEVKTEGDAFMVAFGEPAAALRFCLGVQERLLSAAWPSELETSPDACTVSGPGGERLFHGLRVRMGIHRGGPDCVPDPTTGRMDYLGQVVNRAARVAGAAHGGQILVSGAVWQEVSRNLAGLGSPAFIDLGEHRLKGLEGTERLLQVLPRGLEGRQFPAPRTLDLLRTNLPAHPASFVGRERELDLLEEASRSRARLVTLLGPGGMGKTRLALRFAGLHLETFCEPDGGGAWFCDLSEAADLDGLVAAVSHALQLPVDSKASSSAAIDQLGRALAERGKLLLVLDNFEQVAAHAGTTVGRWLEVAPLATFLVTSRERLRLQGETAIELAPLGLEPGTVSGKDDAVRLFLERARAVRPEYATSEPDLAVVASIVRALDGIPLAIELAASRSAVLAPGEILERLARRFELLAAGRRDAPARQGALWATIDWSWQLLEPWEREALAQCAIFRGGWDLDAAEAVLELSKADGAPPVLDVMQALRDKSLVRLAGEQTCRKVRLDLYLSIRDYALERLLETGGWRSAQSRHASFYLSQAARLTPWFGDGVERLLSALSPDAENFRVVFERAFEARHPDAIPAALAVDRLLARRGPVAKRLEVLVRTLACAGSSGWTGPLVGWLHEAHARALLTCGRAAQARAAFERACVLARSSSDRLLEASCLRGLALVARVEHRMDEAPSLCEQALVLMRQVGSLAGQTLVLSPLAAHWQNLRRYDLAGPLLDEALALHARIDSPRLASECLLNKGLVLQELGDLDAAERLMKRGAEVLHTTRDTMSEAYVLGFQAGLEFERKRLVEARGLYLRAVGLLRAAGEHELQVFFLAGLGACLSQEGRLAEGDRALTTAERLAGAAGPIMAVTLSLWRGIHEVARARTLAAAGEATEAESCLTSARARLRAASVSSGAEAPEETPADRSDFVRLAARLLERVLPTPGARVTT